MDCENEILMVGVLGSVTFVPTDNGFEVQAEIPTVAAGHAPIGRHVKGYRTGVFVVERLDNKDEFNCVLVGPHVSNDLPDPRTLEEPMRSMALNERRFDLLNAPMMSTPDGMKIMTELPLSRSVDLRHLCGPVRDQGSLGSSVAHAAAALFEFEENKRAADKNVEILTGKPKERK